MSVLNQSGEEQVECPLCMEPLEVDDLNFFPCTCGYQICRFCWHRIRTDENGLCPACRKAYSENPADFIPLSKEQVAQLKAKKRQRDQQRKAKLSESRKHLANVRVVQKNLVFVVGLPVRLADAEILKRHEYFGKFGKIHKVVINQSTSYAGSQGPSASAYVTYMKSDDALRAIQNVNNITIDGRLIKSSLGTTKYCSHFMKNQPCPKPDCMYLHDFGDPKASFTKEQMHAGKHQEYERKLHDTLINKMAVQQQQQQQQQQQNENKPGGKGSNTTSTGSNNTSKDATTVTNTNKENWPQLNPDKMEKKPDGNGVTSSGTQPIKEPKEKAGQKNKTKLKNGTECNKKPEKSKSGSSANDASKPDKTTDDNKTEQSECKKETGNECDKNDRQEATHLTKLPILDDNSSFFSQNTFQKLPISAELENDETENTDTQILNDSLPNISSTEDWEAAFGFSKHNTRMDELSKQRNNIKDTLETFGNGFNSPLDMFSSSSSSSNYHGGSYDGTNSSSKLQESILEALSNSSKHNFGMSHQNGVLPSFSSKLETNHRLNGLNNHRQFGLNGLDQQMSKFFNDFYKNGLTNGYAGLNGLTQQHQQQQHQQQQQQQQNGLTNQQPNGYSNGATHDRNLFLLQQRQLEEQLMSLNLKQQSYGNGLHGQFLNGDSYMPSLHHHNTGGQIYSMAGKSNNSPAIAEDDLGFDPFHETQKALAELMENEQAHKLHGGGTGHNSSHINGLVHNQSGNGHIPPPPPGFMQSNNTHMNSFGSKILPYLNMSSTGQQQQQQQNNTNHNWSGNYSQMQQQQQQQQQQQHKGTCNDWKVLDPAIVHSSNHYILANMQPPPSNRDNSHYNNFQPLSTVAAAAAAAQQLQNAPTRSFDYPNFSNYNPQLQANNYNSYSHMNGATQQNLNWLGNELNHTTQIASPPGFRATNQTTKQQEC